MTMLSWPLAPQESLNASLNPEPALYVLHAADPSLLHEAFDLKSVELRAGKLQAAKLRTSQPWLSRLKLSSFKDLFGYWF